MSTTRSRTTDETTRPERVAVAIPMPNDPDWGLFDAIPPEVPIIVIDDSDGRLTPPPRDNVRMFDYAAQREVMGRHYDANPHKSAATRNFGHYLAYSEGYDVIIALDYDCRTRDGWLDEHLDCIGDVTDADALAGAWINPINAPGFYARGYPYEYRNPDASVMTPTTASGRVQLNIGVWDNVLDLNGIDKIQAEPPAEPGLYGDRNPVATGNIPVCGMNTAFAAEVTPAYFFLPDVWVNGTWRLSRHDDIWGGYVLKRLLDVRGDLVTFGRPIVEHTRQSKLERVMVLEQWMHLMSMPFYDIVDAAAGRVDSGSYAAMFAHFAEEYERQIDKSTDPAHYLAVYRELGVWMQRWAAAFEDYR